MVNNRLGRIQIMADEIALRTCKVLNHPPLTDGQLKAQSLPSTGTLFSPHSDGDKGPRHYIKAALAERGVDQQADVSALCAQNKTRGGWITKYLTAFVFAKMAAGL